MNPIFILSIFVLTLSSCATVVPSSVQTDQLKTDQLKNFSVELRLTSHNNYGFYFDGDNVYVLSPNDDANIQWWEVQGVTSQYKRRFSYGDYRGKEKAKHAITKELRLAPLPNAEQSDKHLGGSRITVDAVSDRSYFKIDAHLEKKVFLGSPMYTYLHVDIVDNIVILQAWNRAKAMHTVEAYEDYLRKHGGDPVFSANANSSLKEAKNRRFQAELELAYKLFDGKATERGLLAREDIRNALSIDRVISTANQLHGNPQLENMMVSARAAKLDNHIEIQRIYHKNRLEAAYKLFSGTYQEPELSLLDSATVRRLLDPQRITLITNVLQEPLRIEKMMVAARKAGVDKNEDVVRPYTIYQFRKQATFDGFISAYGITRDMSDLQSAVMHVKTNDDKSRLFDIYMGLYKDRKDVALLKRANQYAQTSKQHAQIEEQLIHAVGYDKAFTVTATMSSNGKPVLDSRTNWLGEESKKVISNGTVTYNVALNRDIIPATHAKIRANLEVSVVVRYKTFQRLLFQVTGESETTVSANASEILDFSNQYASHGDTRLSWESQSAGSSLAGLIAGAKEMTGVSDLKVRVKSISLE